MKLLQKTIQSYFLYSVIILIIAIPLFFLALQEIVREDMDEDLVSKRELILRSLSIQLKKKSIADIHLVDPDITVQPAQFEKESDTLRTIDIFEKTSGEVAPHRVLTSYRMVNGLPLKITITISLVDSDNMISSIGKVEILLLLLLLGGLLIINHRLSKRIWQPFYTTLACLQEYKVSDTKPLELADSQVDEFNHLKQSLLQLTDRSHQAYKSQKEFTENASHEMQTPLAVLQGKLDLLMQTSPISPEQAELISDLASASQRMARLNKSLLLLTKIENNQFTATENISLDQVIRKFIEQHQPQIQEKEIDLVFKPTAGLMINGNKTLLEVLIGNLLGNAIRHNHNKGVINISLEENMLSIQNSGIPAALDEKNIFRRFQKESKDSNSIGLGLEIARKICELYHFTISYKHENGLHVFNVDFSERVM
jgi:signal transduction histidine kinase